MFQKSVVEKYLAKIDKSLLQQKYEDFCKIYKNESKIQNIKNSKEEQYQEGFIRDIFVSILGYTIKPEANYNIFTEAKNESKNKNNSRKSDGAICEENDEAKIKAVIELKGCDTTDLDKVARQAFDYKSHHENCNYVIVSNFAILRVYIETQIDFIEFNLFNLNFENFCIFYLLLELNQIKSDVPLKLKHETVSEEKQITDNFYADYSTFKRLLFEDMIENNAELDKLLLFKKTQKLLDRILFILFCEDRNLLPANSSLGIIEDYQKLKEMGYAQPLYNVFKTFFERINTGFKSESDKSKNIFAYNGGLFKTDEVLDNIRLGDDVLFIHTKRLAQYDFESQISVDILGRIFENSLTEIEEVQKQIEDEKNGIKTQNTNIGKRKKDGVFYTPEYITAYIVENTIGKLCEQKRKELKIDDETYSPIFDKNGIKKAKSKQTELNENLTKYREFLLNLKILDPACGSGAFLNAALKKLIEEHSLIDKYYANIFGDTMIYQGIENTILENNLYGVDINEESVEIAKLSLWLHTAKKDRKLTTLNDKIKCGNSLIDDKTVAGEKAFCWEEEFAEVFAKGGFDVVIGNPPYVSAPTQVSDQKLFANRQAIIESKKYKTLFQKWDLYIPFIELGTKILLKENGYCSMIVPYPLTNQLYAQKCRQMLLDDFNLVELVDLKDCKIFHDATVQSCIFIEEKTKPKNNINISKIQNEKINVVTQKTKETFLQDEKTFVWNTENEIKQTNKHANMNVLGDFCYISKGMVLHNEDKEFSNSDLISNTKDKIHCRKYLEAKDMDSYLINRIRYVEYDTERVPDKVSRPTFRELYELPKLLFNCLGELKTMIDIDEKYICQQSIRVALLWSDLQNVENKSITTSIKKFSTLTRSQMEELSKNIDLKYLLAIMNSKYASVLLTNIRGGDYHIVPEHIRNIPIPNITPAAQEPFIALADKMLLLNKDLQKKSGNFLKVVMQTFNIQKPSTKLENFYELDFDGFIKELKQKVSPKTKLEWLELFEETQKELLSIKTQIDATDKQINSLVYKLYDLTEEEITVVEGV